MEEQKPNVVIDKVKDDANEKKAANEKLIAELQKELDKLQEELDTKKYLVEGGKTIAASLHEFINKEAKWVFTEALGIVEVDKSLNHFITDSKSKELMLGALELEAVYYFMTKHSGVGLNQAKSFLEMLKAINPAKARKDADNRKYEEIKFRIDSLLNGVDPEEIRKRVEGSGQEEQLEKNAESN